MLSYKLGFSSCVIGVVLANSVTIAHNSYILTAL